MEESKKDIIKATVPVLEQHGETITTVFYQNMFEEHPELLNFFNKTNQKVGRQPNALATTVLAAAKHIDNLDAIVPFVIQIGHKHRALQIMPEHYPIVGKHLIKAIKEVLGDAATPEIIDAWTEYYGEIADIFIKVEKDMYEAADWEAFKPFEVVDKIKQSEDVTEFIVKPVDGEMPNVQAGLYITVNIPSIDGEYDAKRHYSISSIDTTKGIHFAVKKEGQGETSGVVSHYMHDQLNIGDSIELSAPAGDFVLEDTDALEEVLFLSGGVGVTPVVSMLEQLVRDVYKGQVNWVQSCYNASQHPFKEKVESLKGEIENFNENIVYSEVDGHLSKEQLAQYVNDTTQVYMCGSPSFMETMLDLLQQLDVDMSRIHFEPLGPKMSVVQL